MIRERFDFCIAAKTILGFVADSKNINQLDFMYELFKDFIESNEGADFDFDNGLVCRWLNGTAKISTRITGYYYENGNIERILDVLLEENVPGAFFVLNNLIIKNTELVKRMHREGHLVCNHTSNHKDQTQLSKKEILEGISNLEDKYFVNTGYTMCKFFRFPEGKFDEKSLQAVSEYGYSTFFWSLAYADWDNSMQISEQEALKKLCNNVHCGAIILLHPTAKTNANIIKEFIQRMKSDGYEFLSLYDLIENNT